MPRVLIALLLTTNLLANCTDFSELDDVVSDRAQNSGYPELIDLNGKLAGVLDGQDDAFDASDSLDARAIKLRRRAAELRKGKIIDARNKRLMNDALRRHPT